MIIRRQVTQTDEIQIKTMHLDNLLQLVKKHNNNPTEATYLFEAQSTQAYNIWIRVHFTTNNQEEKCEEVRVIDEEPEKVEVNLPFNVNELLGLDMESKIIKEEQQRTQSGGHIELAVVIYHNAELYLLQDTKQNYTSELEPFIRALQRKSCIDEKKLQEHKLNYSKHLPITIDLNQNFYSLQTVRYTLKEIFDHRAQLTMYAMTSRNDHSLALTVEGQQLIYQSNHQNSSPTIFLEALQQFMTEDFATFQQCFRLQD
ncbi:hypothetical protein CH76_02165 [Lysinibacillus sp. BF-4]|uniref:hypothetical protein n=1 Tax=Lysinibacillus sp. BF-4 TaxID=1473546 RepID=UPI0005017C04|nr:hypothetical protein [Lysinibacillus sp. BF-4]KFL44622.1 hypothetical protein CH76_02165 [Lysinibacillus sp. BF-4]